MSRTWTGFDTWKVTASYSLLNVLGSFPSPRITATATIPRMVEARPKDKASESLMETRINVSNTKTMSKQFNHSVHISVD
jgi:hypothetical protein